MSLKNRSKRLAVRNSGTQRRGGPRLRLEELETRCLLSATGFRPIDESGNNMDNPTFGTAGINLLRVSPEAYRVVAGTDPNGFFTPSMNGGAPFFVSGSRLVSNDVSNQATVLFGSEDVNTVNQNGLSDFGYTWGQFLDHDMDLTPDTPVNDFPIPVDPTHTDPIGSLAMGRSVFNPATGTTSPREQINVNTAFLDLSQVYGSTAAIAQSLRTGSGGLLKSSPGADGVIGTADDLLPFNATLKNGITYFTTEELAALHMANDTHVVASTDLFAAGDVRANETTELTSLHTLFLRNHNRLAALVAPGFSSITDPVARDEAIYQEARKLNIAQYQNITYNGYLPALLGPTALAAYSGYNSTVNPAISTEFSTVAFRFGHSLLNNTVPRHANDGSSVGDLSLLDSFFNPHFLTPGELGYTDIGAVLKGDADNTSQAMDVMAVSSIRNLLFSNDGIGEDLIARDMWRAHDHGIGTYNDLRVAFGLPAIADTGVSGPGEPFRFHGFELISSDPAVVQKLILAYTGPTREAFLANGKFAGDIDPFIAGLAEDHVPGSDLGPLFHTILVDQFTRLRDGDRFFYLNYQFTTAEQTIIGQGNTLGKLIKGNTSITNLQDDVFFDPSVLIYKAPEAGANVSVVAALGVVTIINNDNGTILAVRSLSSVTRLLLIGSNSGADVFNLFVASANGGIENGISVYGGTGGGDRINVFGRPLQQDTFTVSGSAFSPEVVNVNVNGNKIMSSGFETTRIVTLFGNDIITDPGLLALIVALWNPLSNN